MYQVKRNAKTPWWGALVGFGIAAVLSYLFIVPPDVRYLHLSNATVGDWVRVFVAFVISMVCAWMGYIVVDTVNTPD
jgi:hypothetical protein